MAEGRGRPALSDERRMIGTSLQWTPDQAAWLRARAQSSGIGSVAAVVRQIVQAEIERERQQQDAAS